MTHSSEYIGEPSDFMNGGEFSGNLNDFDLHDDFAPYS
jgi:hypothetical protein